MTTFLWILFAGILMSAIALVGSLTLASGLGLLFAIATIADH